jgi:hypothetical protein
MLLSQIANKDGSITVVAREGKEAYAVRGAASVYRMVRDLSLIHISEPTRRS